MSYSVPPPTTDRLPDPASADSIGARIKLLRQRRGLTQGAFAVALGVSRSAIALWETGRGGEAGHLQQIAELLGVPVSFFVTGMVQNDVTQRLTINENALVMLYRGCDAAGQVALLRAASRMERQSRLRAAVAPSRTSVA